MAIKPLNIIAAFVTTHHSSSIWLPAKPLPASFMFTQMCYRFKKCLDVLLHFCCIIDAHRGRTAFSSEVPIVLHLGRPPPTEVTLKLLSSRNQPKGRFRHGLPEGPALPTVQAVTQEDSEFVRSISSQAAHRGSHLFVWMKGGRQFNSVTPKMPLS